MDVILVSVHNFDPERWVAFHHSIEALLEFKEYIVFQYFSSTLCAPDDVVQVLIGRVVEMASPHGDKRSTL